VVKKTKKEVNEMMHEFPMHAWQGNSAAWQGLGSSKHIIESWSVRIERIFFINYPGGSVYLSPVSYCSHLRS
jgi:hypothetical protein